MNVRLAKTLAFALIAVVAIATAVEAQQRGQGRGQGQGQRGGFRGGFGGFGGGRGGPGRGGLLGLLNVEEVQEEVELIDEQLADVRKLSESLRGERPDGRRGGRPNGERGGRPGGNFGDLSDEERAKLRAEFEKRREEADAKRKEADAKLVDILLPHQLDRVKEIALQVAGSRAILQDEVVAALKITPEQKAKIEETNEANSESMREQMRALFQGGASENMREKITELRTAADEKVLAHLTDQQREQFTVMKGEPFKMPQRNFGGRRGGGRGQGRPQRPEA